MTKDQRLTTNDPRYHALDSLRAFAMFLGVALHAALSFMAKPPPFWAVHDRNPEPLADLFVFAVHDFRMQTFFVLAGFFACLLYRRYGAAGTARHRVKRVAIPLALGVVFIVPTIMAAFLFAGLEEVRSGGLGENSGEAQRFAAEQLAANPGASDAAIILDRITSGGVFLQSRPAHLWFLYYLLIFYAAVLLLVPLLGRLDGTRLLARFDATFRRVVQSRARAAAPALLTLPVLLCMTTPVADTPLSWVPEPQIVAYYLLFFAFGWMLFRHRDLVDAFGRGWRLNLAVANVAVLPAVLGLTFGVVDAMERGAGGAELFAWRLGAFAAQSLYTWLMIVGLWGAFLRYFAHPSPRARYLADASYWCYLASITPIILFQLAVRDWPLPGLVKWVLVTAATTAVLLASYEWCVRYTFIGAILNGRRYRERNNAKEAAAEPVAAAK